MKGLKVFVGALLLTLVGSMFAPSADAGVFFGLRFRANQNQAFRQGFRAGQQQQQLRQQQFRQQQQQFRQHH